MRNVMRNNRELAHVRASQSQAEASVSNFFFKGPSIFSYGHHFEIARILKEPDCVLFTTRRYSISTSKHISYARGAVSHKYVFLVPSFTDHAENAAHYLKSLDAARVSVLRARKSAEWLREQLDADIKTAAEYCALFKKNIPAKLRAAVKRWDDQREAGTLFAPAELAKINKTLADQRENAKAARIADKKRREELKAEALGELDAWARGASNERPRVRFDVELPTRLRVKDGRVETSRGAQITARAAGLLWSLLCSGPASQVLPHVQGLRVDSYQVNGWDGETLTAGCHKIKADELRAAAAALGFRGELPMMAAGA